MDNKKQISFTLGSNEVHPATLKVVVAGKVISLEPKIMSLLVYLANKPKKVVTKEELLESIWHRTTVVDGALQRAISILRKTLNDHKKNPQIIETISKTGYRLMVFPEYMEEKNGTNTSIHKINIKPSPLRLLVMVMALLGIFFLIQTLLKEDIPFAPEAGVPINRTPR